MKLPRRNFLHLGLFCDRCADRQRRFSQFFMEQQEWLSKKYRGS
jgi:hypothetical protein